PEGPNRYPVPDTDGRGRDQPGLVLHKRVNAIPNLVVENGMTRRTITGFLGALVAFVVFSAPASAAAPPAGFGLSHHRVCGAQPFGFARCHSDVVDRNGVTPSAATPQGLDPATIKGIYGFSVANNAGAGKTIAIVDAYDDPTIANDLGVFSSQFGLPACGTGCFTKVNQTGGTSYPRANCGWALEICLDVEWAHAIAPGANILLVEAKSNSFTNLVAAEEYAKAHAQYVSNSWGGSE